MKSLARITRKINIALYMQNSHNSCIWSAQVIPNYTNSLFLISYHSGPWDICINIRVCVCDCLGSFLSFLLNSTQSPSSSTSGPLTFVKISQVLKYGFSFLVLRISKEYRLNSCPVMIYFPWQYGISVFESLICNFSFLFFI